MPIPPDVNPSLVFVANDLVAERGQHLVIVAGVCVAVYTGGEIPRASRGRAAPVDLDDELPPPVKRLAGPVPLVKKKLRQHLGGAPNVTPISVFNALSVTRPMLTIAIGDFLELDRRDTSARGKIWRVLSVLVAEGYAVKEQAQGARKHYLYRRADVSAAMIKRLGELRHGPQMPVGAAAHPNGQDHEARVP